MVGVTTASSIAYTPTEPGKIRAASSARSKDTTWRGDVAELLLIAELVRRGYTVSKPITNSAPYDVLVDTRRSIVRVQIKRTNRTANGNIRVKLSLTRYRDGARIFSRY